MKLAEFLQYVVKCPLQGKLALKGAYQRTASETSENRVCPFWINQNGGNDSANLMAYLQSWRLISRSRLKSTSEPLAFWIGMLCVLNVSGIMITSKWPLRESLPSGRFKARAGYQDGTGNEPYRLNFLVLGSGFQFLKKSKLGGSKLGDRESVELCSSPRAPVFLEC